MVREEDQRMIDENRYIKDMKEISKINLGDDKR